MQNDIQMQSKAELLYSIKDHPVAIYKLKLYMLVFLAYMVQYLVKYF